MRETIKPIYDADAKSLLAYLLLLTGFYFLLEISFFIQCNQAYFSDFTFVSDRMRIPAGIILPSLFYLGVQISLHLVYCVTVWIIALLNAALFQLTHQKRFLLAISLWLVGLITILIANRYYFPNSKFADLVQFLLPTQSVAKIALSISSIMLFICFFMALSALILRIPKMSFTIVAAAYIGLVFIDQIDHPAKSPIASPLPNIIIIGVDSFRPDFLGFFGRQLSTPFYDKFLSSATVFTEAFTPLARTFPSWTTILTGQYPLETGVRTNLAKQEGLNLSDSLPAILQRHGYETVYATDETRFSNINTNFGFDHIITPPVGLTDFLLGTFNDFPLSNMLVNTWFGEYFFPNSYANRAAFVTYDPHSFNQLVKQTIVHRQFKPMFMAVHLCLPHFPFIWGDIDARDYSPLERYAASIKRVDEQVSEIYQMLNANHLLDHAIVILLSDHGEALELAGDRITNPSLYEPRHASPKTSLPLFYPPSLFNEAVNQSGGHGTDVLGLPQYHSLLAFKVIGEHTQQAKQLSGLVTLLDIKPTILALLNLPSAEGSGVSLLDALTSSSFTIKKRDFFLESDFSPAAIRTVYPETHQALLEGVDLFEIDPRTMRLTVKTKMTSMIINSKQYADIYGEWMLAYYPEASHTRLPILINLETGEWTDKLNSKFAQSAPLHHMREALHKFYGKEIE